MRALTAALLTAAIAATGIVAVLAVAARGQDTGRSPAPDTPRSHRADPPDPSYRTPKRVRDARPAPMPTDPRAVGGRQSPP